MKVSDSIYVFQDKDLGQNATLILGNDACILVDNRQNIPIAQELQTAIKSITDKPIKYIINTHYHGDHTFGNQVFTGVTDIIGHKNVRTTLLEIGEQHKGFFGEYFGVPRTEEVVITPPTLTFEKELSLQFDNKTINIVYPGRAHTDTDSFIYIPELKLLITGDLLFNGILGFSGDPSCTLRGWINAVEDMEKLDINTIIPGHGPIGNKGDLALFRQYLERLLMVVKQEIEKGRTLTEMKESVKLPEYKDWGHYEDWLSVNIEAAYNELSH
ncbi:MAG: MBL fold metallo-hydrolase [Candidatus Brocadiales bacterium]